MRRWFRQAGTITGQVGHHTLRLVGTLALVVMLLIGAAAWRLARGPVDLPILASRIGAAATAAMPGTKITIDHAGLAWEGFNRGGAPLDLRLSGIAILGRNGAVAARISRLRITLAAVPLLRGRIAPIEIIAHRTAVAVRPDNAPRPPPTTAPPVEPADRLATAATTIGRLIGSFAQLPRAGGLDLADLRRISITHAALAFDDPHTGVVLNTNDATLDLTRSAAGVLHGTAQALLHHGKSGSVAPIRIEITGADGLGMVKAVLGPADPATIAPDQPSLARANLPITITARWPIGRRATAQLDLAIHAGAGRIKAGGSVIGIAGFDARLTATPTTARLDAASLTLAGPTFAGPAFTRVAPTPGPTAHATGTLDLTGTMHGTLDATVDHVTAAELPFDWPLHLAPGPRKYVVNHVTAGTARNGSFHVSFTLAPAKSDSEPDSGPASPSQPSLDAFSGQFAAAGVTLAWFKHAVPLTDLTGSLTFVDQDILIIQATSGHLGGLGMVGSMTIAALTHHDQNSLVLAHLTGSAAAAVPLLDAPPLKLAANGIGFAGTTGTLDATIDAGIKLTKHVTLADVTLAARTTITQLHLALPVPGLALDQGHLTLNASLTHLALHGAGTLAGQPARFTAGMALPNGKFTLQATTTAGRKLLAKLGADAPILQSGAAPLAITYQDHNGAGALDLTADLTPLALALPAMGWHKTAGIPGHARLALLLHQGRPTAVQSIDIATTGLALQGDTEAGALVISRAQLGATSATGKLTPPATAKGPWVLALAGPSLDLSAALDAANADHAGTDKRPPPPKPSNPKPGPTKPGPTPLPWRLRAAFDSIRLDRAPAPSLGAVHIEATGNAASLTEMAASVRTDPDHDATLHFKQAGATDTVNLATGNAGALFAAIGTTDDIANGTLRLDATTIGSTTDGTAILTDFRLRHAPVIAKVLQGMSLYGVPAATSGPGLAITRLTAPFSITGPIVRLGNGRAYSASLGFTATGTIDTKRKLYDLSGTIVPAYAINTLPGRIPLIGKLFSPEKGSGLFAARYSVSGPFAKPHIAVNPLSALTPGFLRDIFNIFNAPASGGP
jgi:hypothetical protein